MKPRNASRSLFTAVASLAALIALAVGLTPAAAQVPGSAINLGPIQPSPGWGNSCTYNLYASVNGRAVNRAQLIFWFSGRHGLESYHWSGTTNSQGRVTAVLAIPRTWASTGTWVNFNCACPSLGKQVYWRVKQ